MLTTHAAAAFPVLADAAWKGTALLLLALGFASTLRRARAAYRHLVWALAMTGLLAAPPVSWLLPSWQLPISWPASTVPAPEAHTALERNLLAMADPPEAAQLAQNQRRPVEEAAVIEGPSEVAASASHAHWATWLCAVWLVGTLLAALWFIAGVLSIWRLARRCKCVETGLPSEISAELCSRLGIRRPVRLLVSVERTMPMTWGHLRPMILLPEEALSWTAQRLRIVLTHELGHVRRWDYLTHLLGQLARGLFWFHPLVWLALYRLRREQELACDDMVLAGGASAVEYGEHLLAVTAGRAASAWPGTLALAIGRECRLEHRLQCLLDANRSHLPPRRRTIVGAIVLAVTMILALGTAGVALKPTRAFAQEQPVEGQSQVAQQSDLVKKLTEVRDKLAKHYVEPLDEKALTEQALKGLLQGLRDPYTDYLSADDLKQVDGQIKGKISGIGAQLAIVDDRLTVTTPLEDSPALKAGIRPGDQIVAVDGKNTRGMSMSDATQLLLGPAGTVVKLIVAHPEGVVEELAITRGEVRVPSTSGFRRRADGRWQYLLDGERRIGYIHIANFASGTAAEVRAAVQGLQKKDLKGLILDLRFCPGGLLDEALEVTKLFLADGIIVTIRGPGKQESVFRADGKTTMGDFPIILLINEQTASAAEIVAGALRDHGRAVLLGTRTFGKGSVQTLVNLDGGGALRLTTAHYYLPSGRNIQKRPGEAMWGVDPSEGFYLALSEAQTAALKQNAQNRALVEIKKVEDRAPLALTAKEIKDQHADPQLAAALRSIVGRVTGGQFLQVGSAGSM
jgi:carboxyl-terminal processing protease